MPRAVSPLAVRGRYTSVRWLSIMFSVPVGIHIYSVDEREELDHRIEQGFQLLTVMLDTALFYQACVRVLKAVRPQ